MKNQVKLLFYAISLMAIAVSCGKELSQLTPALVDLGLSVKWRAWNYVHPASSFAAI